MQQKSVESSINHWLKRKWSGPIEDQGSTKSKKMDSLSQVFQCWKIKICWNDLHKSIKDKTETLLLTCYVIIRIWEVVERSKGIALPQKMLFWKQLRWSWQPIGEKEINKIRENPVLHPQTAAKNTASKAGMIHDDCAFSLQRQSFNIIMVVFPNFDSVLHGFPLWQQNGFKWQYSMSQT